MNIGRFENIQKEMLTKHTFDINIKVKLENTQERRMRMINTRKLKARIQEMGFTQSIVAEKIGIDPSSLNKKVNDMSGKNLSIEEVEKLCDILQIPAEFRDKYFFI